MNQAESDSVGPFRSKPVQSGSAKNNCPIEIKKVNFALIYAAALIDWVERKYSSAGIGRLKKYPCT